MPIAITDQKKARLLDLTTGILEMVRDENRSIDEVLNVFQLIKDEPGFATRLLAQGGAPAPAPEPIILNYSADGEVFELALNGDAAENQPFEMVRRDGYNHKGWKHKGPTVKGMQIRKFAWVYVGYQPNLDAVRAACLQVARGLGLNGRIPEGQWRETFKQMFQHDDQHPRGIADPSWFDPDGGAYFPCVSVDGRSDFGGAGRDFGVRWRWLVEASK